MRYAWKQSQNDREPISQCPHLVVMKCMYWDTCLECGARIEIYG